VTKKTHGIDNCFLSKFIDFGASSLRMIFLHEHLSRSSTFRYLLQLWLANNEGGKTTFVEISRIVLEITRQIYDRREWTERGARGSPFCPARRYFSFRQEESSNVSIRAQTILDRGCAFLEDAEYR